MQNMQKWLPWIIVAAVAAVVVVIIAVNSGGDDEAAATTTTAGDTTTTSEDTTTTTGETTTTSEDTTTTAPVDGPTVTIGSANFSESALVAEIYAQALEAAGYKVDRKLNIGSREIYAPALEAGELDLVPEYIGTMLTHLGGTATSDSVETHAALQVAWEPAGIQVLDFAPAQDKNGFVVTQATAASLGLTKVSDLAAHNGTLVLGGPPECPEREFCLKGLESLYGLDFKEFKPLDVGGPITVAALEGDEIQVGLLFTTDGTIVAKGFVLLEDDKGLQPAENLVPAVRSEIIDTYGDHFKQTLNAVSAKLTTEDLAAMNKLIGFDGEDPEKVAAEWLKTIGVVE